MKPINIAITIFCLMTVANVCAATAESIHNEEMQQNFAVADNAVQGSLPTNNTGSNSNKTLMDVNGNLKFERPSIKPAPAPVTAAPGTGKTPDSSNVKPALPGQGKSGNSNQSGNASSGNLSQSNSTANASNYFSYSQGTPPKGVVPQGMAPQGMAPQGMPPQGMVPQGMAPQGMPPQGMAPQGMPPQGMPPQGMPPQGMPPQGMPPQGMPCIHSRKPCAGMKLLMAENMIWIFT